MNKQLKYILIGSLASILIYRLYNGGKLNKLLSKINSFGLSIPLVNVPVEIVQNINLKPAENAIKENTTDIGAFKRNLSYLKLIAFVDNNTLDEDTLEEITGTGILTPSGNLDAYFVQNFNYIMGKVTGQESPKPTIKKDINPVIKKGDKGNKVLKLISVLNAIFQDNELTEGVYDIENVLSVTTELFNGATCYGTNEWGEIDENFINVFYNLIPSNYHLF